MNQNTQTLFWRANTVIIAHQEPLYEEWKIDQFKICKNSSCYFETRKKL